MSAWIREARAGSVWWTDSSHIEIDGFAGMRDEGDPRPVLVAVHARLQRDCPAADIPLGASHLQQTSLVVDVVDLRLIMKRDYRADVRGAVGAMLDHSLNGLVLRMPLDERHYVQIVTVEPQEKRLQNSGGNKMPGGRSSVIVSLSAVRALSRQHGATDDAAGAQIIERRLRFASGRSWVGIGAILPPRASVEKLARLC